MSKKIMFLVAIGTIFWGSVISGNDISVDAVKPEKKAGVIVPKDPLIAGLLSTQCPGLGQIYCRRYLRAVAYLVGEMGCFVLASAIAGAETKEYSYTVTDEDGKEHKLTRKETIDKWDELGGGERAGAVGLMLAGVGIYIWNVIDAYNLAHKYNEERLGWIRDVDVQLGFKDNGPSLKLAVSNKF